MERVDVSVIVPVYNGEKYIKKIINAAMPYREEAIELVFVNDGSSDNSWDTLQEFCKKYEFVRSYNKKNGGIADTRNFGLKKAVGRYVTFMDQDDDMDFSGLKIMKNLLDKEKADFLISNFVNRHGSVGGEKQTYVLKNGIIQGEPLYLMANDFLTTHCACYFDMEAKCGIKSVPPVIWNCMYSKRFLEEHKITFFRMVDFEDDYLFMIQALCKAKKICTLKAAYYIWNIHSESESHREKYIPDFYKKRRELNAWLHNYAVERGIVKEQLFQYDCFLYRLLCIKGYRNVCSKANVLTFFDKKRELKKLVCSNERGEQLSSDNEYVKDRIVIWLLKKHWYGLSIIFGKMYDGIVQMKVGIRSRR